MNYGANDPITVAMATGFVYILLLLTAISTGISENVRLPLSICFFVLLAILAWVLFQIAPLPEGWPIHPAWLEVRKLNPEISGSISVTPGDDLGAYLKIALPFGAFMLSLLLFGTDRLAERALRLYGIVGGVVAIFSIIQFVFWPKTLLFVEKAAYLDSLTGFFVNRNTAATFFGIVSLLLFALLWRSTKDVQFRRLFAALLQPGQQWHKGSVSGWSNLIYALLFVMTLLALVMTKSRAGVGATFVSLSLLGILLGATRYSRMGTAGFTRRPEGRLLRRLWLFAGLPLVFLAILGVIGGNVVLRADVRGAEDPRFCALPGIAASVRDHFPWGGGLASFQEIFPAYRNPSCGVFGVWDKAHNVYLEGTLGLGIMFPIALVIVVASLVYIFVRGIRERREYRFAGCLGLATLLLVALHSAVDFSLQIPGFALAFSLMLAPLVTISLGKSQSTVPHSASSRRGMRRKRSASGAANPPVAEPSLLRGG
ncbi:O-antigen ligase family protein [Rhizobium cremeum]|uniref:O-antigen ligase family protein n=1 Tax=Rhizobium cremeum TaxID=2813827 RepID=UPI0013AF13B4